MTYHFVAQDLHNEQSPPLPPESIRRTRLPTVLVLPHQNLRSIDNWHRTNRYSQLALLLDGRCENSLPGRPGSGEWTPQENSYTACGHINESDRNLLVQSLIRRGKDASDNLLIVTGCVYQSFHDLFKESHLETDSYLIWDDGDQYADTLTFPTDNGRAWRGAGWLSLAQRQTGKDDGDLERSFRKFRHEIDDMARNLVNRHDEVNRNNDSNGSRTNSISPIARVAHRLARFLPDHLIPDKDRNDSMAWQPYGFDSTANLAPLHGPIPWQGWRDANLDDLERDLIFESWLTPFYDEGAGLWTLQPASLLLLYWAAWTIDLWPGLSPGNFIAQHNWHGWFGGRVKDHD